MSDCGHDECGDCGQCLECGRWRRPEDEMPPEGARVNYAFLTDAFTMIPPDGALIGFAVFDGERFELPWRGDYLTDNPDLWCPIPPLPQEDE